MNYVKHYNKLIENAIIRNWDKTTAPCYVESHHIKPTSMCKTSKRYGTINDYTWDVDADEDTNIVCLTAKEHYVAHHLLYKIYKSEKTALAWFMMHMGKNRRTTHNANAYENAKQSLSYELKKSPRLSEQAKKTNAKRIKDGTHLFLNSHFQQDMCKRQLENGTHPFLGGEMQRNNINRLVKEGKYHMTNIPPWNNPSTSESAQHVWKNADEYYELWIQHKCANKKLATLYGVNHCSAHKTAYLRFTNGWVPMEDQEWLKYKNGID